MEPTDCGCRDPAETSSLIVAAPASAAAGVVGRLVLDTSTVAVVDDANWSASFEGAENCVVLVLFALAYATLALRRSVAASWRRRREGFGGGAKPGVEAVPFEAEASERTKKSLKQARSARIHADNVRRRSSALLSNNEADVDSDFSLEPVRKKAASPASPAAPVPAATDLPARHTAPRSHSNAKKNNRAALHNNKSRHRCHLQSYQSAGDAGENSHSDADASPTTPMLNQIDAVLDSVPAARIARATDSNHCVLLYDPANGSNHESDHLQPTRTAVQFQDGQTGSNTSIPLSSNTVVIQKDHTPSSAPAIVDPTFEFPKRNFSAASNTNTFNDSLMFSSGFRPPTITTMRDSSLTDSSTHCPTRMSSSTPVGAGANGNNSGHTDTDSKSNLSNSVKTIMTFEHSVKLKDGDDGGSENSADRPSGLGSFWRRGFSRPPSIHETPESSAAASSPSGSGLLPKLNLFGKRKSQADVVAIAGSAAAEALLSPVSPTVAGIMKGFFLGGKKSPAADGEFDAVLMPPPAGLDGAAESETRAPVPILKLPKNKKERNGKGNPPVSSSSSGVRATPASNEKGDKANGDKKSVASSSEGSSRFWSSSSKSKRRGAGEPIVVPLRDYLSSDAGGEKNSLHGKGKARERQDQQALHQDKHPFPVRHKRMASSGGDANLAVFDPTILLEESAWVDIAEPIKGHDKHSLLSRFKWGQPGIKQKAFSQHANSSCQELVARTMASNSSAQGTSTAKFFSLRKRTSNEAMKTELLRLAATSKPFTPAQLNIETSQVPVGDEVDAVFASDRFISSPTLLPFLRDSISPTPHYDQFSTPQRPPRSNSLRLSDSDESSLIIHSMRKQHTLLNPIHRPGSAGGSIASAPGSNRKSHSVNEDLTPETPCGAVYSPFFSGLDFPLTQRPSSSLSSTSAGTAPRVREIHHHHHFYHYPDSPPINMPVANVMKRSEELKDGMRRLRKLSADAGLYTHTDAADDLMFAGRGERNGKRVVSGLSAKSSDSTFQDRDDFMSQLEK